MKGKQNEPVDCTGCGVSFVPKRKRQKGDKNFHSNECREEYYKTKKRAERRALH